MSDVIIVEKMDQWIKITLNRPERLNALNVEMHLAFRAALEAVGDARAVKLARRGQVSGIFDELPLIQQVFALMPLEHSELLSDQALCVQGMTRLFELASIEDKPRFQSFVHYACEHKAIVERFGRFPHRNQLLSRVSTENERRFLAHAKTYGQSQTAL